jgi:heme/copper-type cytochrome/quinol oxidase subunit 4
MDLAILFNLAPTTPTTSLLPAGLAMEAQALVGSIQVLFQLAAFLAMATRHAPKTNR